MSERASVGHLMLFPRLYSGMQARDRALVVALASLAAVALLSAISADQAFAELSSTHNLQDAPAVTDGSPRTFSRSINESVSVASNFGDQGVRIPRVFNVGISDGLTITTSPSSPASNSASSPARTNSFTGAGRAEERLGPRNPFESRSEPGSTSTASGTTEESKESASYDIETILSMVGQELFSSDDSEPDDNSPQIVALQTQPTLYMDALYGAYGLAVIVLATSKTGTAKSMARRIAKSSGTEEVAVARVGRVVVLVAAGMVMAVATSAGVTSTSAAGPIPTYVGAGTAASGASTITPTLPGSLQTNDILLMFVETADQAVTVSNQNGLTWTQVTNSPQSAALTTRLTVFWARYDGSAGNPTLSDSGNHGLAIIHAFRGVIATGDPWDVTSGNAEAVLDTSLSATGATTTSTNTLVVIAAAIDDDSDSFGATWTNANLANIAERSDSGTTQGNDGRLGVVTGEKATAGAYGATTNTLTSASTKAMMTIALKPAPLSATGSPSETVTLTDSVIKYVTKSVSESLSVSDSVTRAIGYSRSASDTLTVAPAADGDITGYSRSAAETVAFDVDIQASIGRSVSTSSTITVTDSIGTGVTITPDSNVAGMAYASTTGNGINYPKYREWDPETKTWGAEVELESAGSPVRTAWIEFSPISTKRVIIALSDDGTLDSYVCDFNCIDPDSWVVNHDVADLWSTALDAPKRPFDIEFENTSGDLMLVYDRVDGDLVDTDIFYRIMPDSDTAFGDEQSFNDSDLAAPDIVYNFFRLDARRTTGSNDLGLIALSETNSRAIAWYWDGTTETFGNELLLSSSMSTQDDYEAIGIGFETYTGDLVAVAGEGSVVKSYQFSSGSWDAGTTVTTLSVGTVQWMRFVANQNAGTTLIQLVASGSSGGLDTAVWDGTAWDGYSGGTRHDATIDSVSIRAFDWAWDNAGDATRGILVWSSSSGVVTYKRYTATDTWTATKTFSDDGATHGWVSLNEHFNPTSADSVSVLGAVIDGDSDVSQMRWDGSANEPHAWDDDGATSSGTTTSESFHVDFRRSPVLKKFPSQTITITDSISVQKSLTIPIEDTVTVAESIVGEKGSPTDSSRFGAVYRSNTGGPLLNSPKYREWDPATQAWSDEVVLPNTGSPVRDAQIRFSPSSALRVVVSHSDSGALNLFVCDNACTSASSWTLLEANFADTGTPVAGKPYKPYDIMFETTGERLIIVYDKEGTADDDFYYRTFDGTTLSAETGVNLGGSADSEDLRYLSLAPHPTTDEMALAALDATNSKSYGVIWDGSSWGNVQTVSSALSTENKDGESVGVAYETETGAALVFSGNGQNSAAYSRWTGSSWSSVSTANPDTTLSTEHVKFVSIKADPSGSSSDIMVCQSDQSNDDLHLTCAEFAAGSPGTWNTITSTIGTTAGRAFDFAYHPSNGKGMLVASSGASGTLDYRVWSGSSFGGAATVQAAGSHKWVFGLSATSATDVVNGMFLKSNSNFDTGGMKYKADVTTLVGDGALTSDSFNDTFESMHMDVQRSKVVRRAVSDTLAVAVSATGEFTTGRLVTETLAVSDSIAKSVVKPLSESVSISDAIAKSTSRAVDDAIGIADAISTRVTRAIDDSISVADAISKSTTRSLSEDLAVNDDITPAILRTASDSLSITDAIASSVSRTMTETVEIADGITPIAGRPVADSITVTDTISRSVSRATADSVTLTDSISTTVSRSIADSVTVADTVSGLPRPAVADTVTVTDAVATRVTRAIEDSISVTDEATPTATRQAAETVTVADAISTRVTRAIEDAVTVTDAIASVTIVPVSETLTVADAISTRVTRSVSDSLTVEDSAAKSVAINVSDALVLDDGVIGFTGYAGSVSDTVAVTDSVSMTVGRPIAETLTVTDAASTNSVRNISDSVAISDEIPTSVSRAADDSITVSDDIATTMSRAIEDSLSVTDAITGTPTPTIADAIAVTDSVSMSVSRNIAETLDIDDVATPASSVSISDALAVADTVSTLVTRSLAEEIAITETATSGAFALMPETMTVTDAISMRVTRSVSDSVTVEDGAAKSVTVFVSDSIGMADSAVAFPGYAASITETLTISDATETATTRSAQETLAVADTVATNVHYYMAIEDSLTAGDVISINGEVVIFETITVADSVSIHVTRALADEVTVADAASAGTGGSVNDSLAVTDAVSMHVTRVIADAISIVDEFGPDQPGLEDTVGVSDAITGISISWNRNFEEELTLESCGPVSCGWMLDFDEFLALVAEFDTPKIEDKLKITDSITLGPNDLSAVPPVEDEIEISDSVTGVILGILVVDDHSSIGELPSTELTGNYTYTGDAEELVYSILDIPIPINSTVVRPNLPDDITILRTYYVPITPTTEIPGEDVIISEIHSEVPADSNMFLRINFEETPALSGEDFLKILDIEFTPAVESTDFALVVSLMDGPPAPGGVQSPTPSEAIRPIYIDVKWVGDFPGIEDPSVQEYYENPPTFTFQVNDEWVEENSADVDSNGVPLLKLWLLNEADNAWEQITTIDRPSSGVDGTYTFVATLPHFSDYAITANPVSTSTGGGGGGGGSSGEEFAVNLVDALGLFESPKGQAIEIIDIPVGIKYTANLLDSVVVSSRPVAYNTFEILKDVEVSITIVDVRQETALPPSAVAELETLIVNRGDTHEEFTLNFWYNDQTGERRWNLSLFVELDPHSTKTIPVEIPFTEPGTYRVTAEARGVPGNELLESTQLTVMIPWLSVYIYVLIMVAVAILGGSGLAIALYMARNATLIAAGAGAGAAILIAAKRHKPRVRVAEWKEGAEDDDYDLLVNVTLANGKEGWLAPGELAGTFEFEIINRSRSKQEFVLAYYLEDVAGIKAPESAGIVKIGGHKEELRRDRVALPSRGSYVLWVEARTHKGEVLSRDRVAVRSA